MQPNQIVHTAPQKTDPQGNAYPVISSAPIEKSISNVNKKKLRLRNEQENTNLAQNINSNNNEANNLNAGSGSSSTSSIGNSTNVINNANISNPNGFIFNNNGHIPGLPMQPPYFPQQQQPFGTFPQNQYVTQYYQGQIGGYNNGVPTYQQQENVQNRPHQYYPNQNQYNKPYSNKKVMNTNLTTTNNSQTPQNTPHVVRESNNKQFFGEGGIMTLFGQLTNDLQSGQQSQHYQKNQTQNNKNYNQFNINIYNNSNPIMPQQLNQEIPYQPNNLGIRQYKEDGGQRKSIPNKQFENTIVNEEAYKQKQYNAQYEEQRQQEILQKQKEEEELIRKQKEEEEERIRQEQERQRQLEIERQRQQEEEERKRIEEEERKRKEDEERRIQEQIESEKYAKLLEERKRPTFEKISYFITSIVNQTIKITYDDGSGEEIKKSIEKFEERKLTENPSDDKKAPTKAPYPGGTKKMDRSNNQPTSSNYGRNSNVNTFPNSGNNNNSNMIQRQAPDPDEIRLQESAKRGWLNQQNQVDEQKQKLKDIKRLTNILTYDNIDKLKVEFLKYSLDETTCQDNIAAIMEKAITEIKYTALYGQLCKYLNDEIKKTNNSSQFKNIFITQIQEKFDNISQVLKVKPNRPLTSMTPEERTDFHGQRKKRIILLVKFIGELFIQNVISKHVIRIVVAELMQKYFRYKDIVKLEESQDNYIHYDDCLQGIIELYEIIAYLLLQCINKAGSHLDYNQKKDNSKVDFKCIDEIKKQIIETKTLSEQYFCKLENIGFQDMISIMETYKNHGDVSHRIKALLLNLIERRNKNWEERLFQKEKPKTLQEIKQEHERDLQLRAEEVENFIKNGGKNLFHAYKPAPQVISKKPTGRGYANVYQTKKDSDNDDIDEEEKESQKKNSGNNYSLLFGAPQQNAPQAKATTEQLIDYESKIKEIYQNIDKQEEVEAQQKSIQDLCKQDKKKVLAFLVSMCYTEKNEQNMIRTQFLINLIKETYFSPSEVTEILNSIFAAAQKEACDYPDVYKCLSQIIESLIVNYPTQFNLQNIFIQLTGDEDDDFDILYFFEELFNELFKPFKENGSDLAPLKSALTKVYQNAKLEDDKVSEQVSKFF